ncbi:ATP synthase subunit delta [Microbacterium sp. C448]|uniref:F0F1 ATP synthase subunit delta n=1 Tax=Microbacterium sp. C448 TaxID=1177594 RepID=UPI0003DE4490|nr:F0F1 ATP synthase subunit delta [Microbacterium sp. C448]CDJ99426.1 ATP synthase subunit delta [Microbacterium sp. C448]
MGSATTQAQRATNAELAGAKGLDLAVASQLFHSARVVGSSSHLSGALADPSASPQSRRKVVEDVFGATFAPTSVSLLAFAVEQRWSSAADLIAGIEELAIRVVAISAGAGTTSASDIEGELFSFSRTVTANPELELALGSRLGDATAKGALVDTLLAGRVSAGTALIVSSIVQQPGERRIRESLSRTMRIVSDELNRTVATVTTATPLTDAQAAQLIRLLSAKYGRDVSLNTVVDEAVVGGLRVQIADDVIDASVSARLAELRQRLAG